MGQLIQELLFSDLLRIATDPQAPVTKVYDIEARFMDIRMADFALHWETRDLGPKGSKRIHDTYFGINPRKDAKRFQTATEDLAKIRNNLPALRAFLVNGMFSHAHVNFYCSCESYVFSGFAYILGKFDSQFGSDADKEKRPPVKRNPGEKGVLCKHGIGIIKELPQFYEPILRELHSLLQHQDYTQNGPQIKKFEKVLKNENPWVKISVDTDNLDYRQWLDDILAYDPQTGETKEKANEETLA